MPPRTPLLRPDRFFAERDFHGLRLLALTVVLTASGPAAVYGLGLIVTDRVDGSVMVDNPDRPPDFYCETASDDADACGEPERIEQDVDVAFRNALEGFYGAAILGFPLALLLVGGLLHAGSWLLAAENGAPESFAVAAWGLAPSVIGLVVSLGLLWLTFDSLTVTPETGTEPFVAHVRTQLRPIERIRPAITVVTALWSGVVWRYGLVYERGLAGGEATGLAGGVAMLYLLAVLV